MNDIAEIDDTPWLSASSLATREQLVRHKSGEEQENS